MQIQYMRYVYYIIGIAPVVVAIPILIIIMRYFLLYDSRVCHVSPAAPATLHSPRRSRAATTDVALLLAIGDRFRAPITVHMILIDTI